MGHFPERIGSCKPWFLKKLWGRGTKNLARREYYNIEPTGGNPTQMTLARGEWSHHCAKPAPMGMPANLKKGRGGVSNEILENIKDTSSHLVLNYPQWIMEEEGEGE